MQVVINHLTRMKKGYICVAGVQRGTTRHIRPVLAGAQQLGTDLLARHGGVFEIGFVVELGKVRPAPKPPETEDHEFDPRSAQMVGQLKAKEFWTLLRPLSKRTLGEVFGDALTQRGATSCGLDVGGGTVSLGLLRPESPPVLYVKTREAGKQVVRMKLADLGFHKLDLSVTDIRLYQDDHVTPDQAVVEQAAKRLKPGAEVILSVGLTRPFSSSHTLPACHWLQVNNIHFATDPLWRRG